MKKLVVMLVVLVSVVGLQAMTITDNFDDGIIGNGPDTGAPASWSGDIDVDAGWDADGSQGYGHPVGTAACNDGGKRMDLNFGAGYSYVEIDFELKQENGTEAGYRMEFGFITDTGDFLMEASPEKYRYGGAPNNWSIPSYDGLHNITGAPSDATPGYNLDYINQKLPTWGWQHFKLIFDGTEDKYAVRLYTEDQNDGAAIDQSKGYGTLIYAAYMENHINTPASTALGFFWKNRDGVVSWQVDDVAVTPEPASLLLLSLGGLSVFRRKG